jgi:hypothetical protein
MSVKPKRRWYQFSLRTMFVGVTLVCAVSSWVAYTLNWKKQRWEALRSGVIVPNPYADRSAPIALWPFETLDYGWYTLKDASREAEMKRLFPEGRIVLADY